MTLHQALTREKDEGIKGNRREHDESIMTNKPLVLSCLLPFHIPLFSEAYTIRNEWQQLGAKEVSGFTR